MIREHVIQIDGRRTRYLEAGAGWPLLLIHAFPLNADMWRSQLERVPVGGRFIAPDLRGFGPHHAMPPSTGVADSSVSSLDDYASDLDLLLSHLKIDELVIGGLSMGGYVTFALFRQTPDRFTAMILADTKATADTPEGLVARTTMRELLAKRGPTGVADQMIPKLLSAATRSSQPAVVEETRRLILANDPPAIDRAIEAMMVRPDSTPDLPRVQVPALVVVGEADVLTPPAESEALHKALGRSILTVIPGAGHLSNLEQPAEFTLALNDFLAAHM